jgi:hypothetical protein
VGWKAVGWDEMKGKKQKSPACQQLRLLKLINYLFISICTADSTYYSVLRRCTVIGQQMLVGPPPSPLSSCKLLHMLPILLLHTIVLLLRVHAARPLLVPQRLMRESVVYVSASSPLLLCILYRVHMSVLYCAIPCTHKRTHTHAHIRITHK